MIQYTPRTHRLVGLLFLGVSLRAAESQCSNRFHIQGPEQILTLEAIHGFAFVRGAVNATNGRFMFDTGSKRSLALNDHLLTMLGPGTNIGDSSVQSGQTFHRILHPCVASIQLTGAGKQSEVLDVESNSLAFVEHITPDFLGFLGFESFDGYAVKVDYGRKMLSFFQTEENPDLIRDALKGESILATIPFESSKLPNHPVFNGKLGSEPILITLDSGQEGLLSIDSVTQKVLVAQGSLTLTSSGNELDRYLVSNLEIAPHLNVSLEALQISSPSSEANEAIGIENQPSITLGFRFLQKFTTVWDFPHRTLYVLQIARQ